MVYGRAYGGRELTFEISGGLLNAALVMRDLETDSWWSITTGDAIAGELSGTPLEELPVAAKASWGTWRERHPESRVLSVGGVEHVPENVYDGYFAGPEVFREISTPDPRLPDKEPIFALRLGGRPLAVPHSAIEGGAAFELPEGQLFLHRGPGSPLFASTESYLLTGEARLESRGGRWIESRSGSEFRPGVGFQGVEGKAIRRTGGFDTFWYIWSLTHTNTTLLGQKSPR